MQSYFKMKEPCKNRKNRDKSLLAVENYCISLHISLFSTFKQTETTKQLPIGMKRLFTTMTACLLTSAAMLADAPVDYYSSLEGKSGESQTSSSHCRPECV